MKIAILGGSFDPPHIGHMLLANQVKEKLDIDKVWLMPCFIHPFNKKLSPCKHRLNMVKLLENKNIESSDFEIKQKGVSYTIETLKKFSKIYPSDKFFWVISSSELEFFPKWKDWQEIVEKFRLIIFPRNINLKELKDKARGYLGYNKSNRRIIILDSQDLILTNISSTEIKKRIRRNLSISSLVSGDVEKYILKNKLYK